MKVRKIGNSVETQRLEELNGPKDVSAQAEQGRLSWLDTSTTESEASHQLPAVEIIQRTRYLQKTTCWLPARLQQNGRMVVQGGRE